MVWLEVTCVISSQEEFSTFESNDFLQAMKMQLLDTSPRWLRLTFACSAGALIVVGVGILFNQITVLTITPFSLLLHFAIATAGSAWFLNFRLNVTPDKKSLLAIGAVVAIGSAWSSLQQWLGYIRTGATNDITLVIGSMTMDAAGGYVTYILFHTNILKKNRGKVAN